MGASYTVLPVNKDIMPWLERFEHIDITKVYREGRYPTIGEIKKTLDKIGGFHTEYYIGPEIFEATISSSNNPETGLWASLIVPITSPYREDVYQEFYFEKGWLDLIILILKGLTIETGPLVLISSSSGTPTLINDGE